MNTEIRTSGTLRDWAAAAHADRAQRVREAQEAEQRKKVAEDAIELRRQLAKNLGINIEVDDTKAEVEIDGIRFFIHAPGHGRFGDPRTLRAAVQCGERECGETRSGGLRWKNSGPIFSLADLGEFLAGAPQEAASDYPKADELWDPDE